MLGLVGEGKSAKEIAAWLKSDRGVEMTVRGVRLALAKEAKKDRALTGPIAQAVAQEKTLKTVGANVDAVNELITRAVADEDRARSVKDCEEKLEAIVQVALCDYLDVNGAFKPWDKLTRKQQLAVVSYKVEQVHVPGLVRHDDGEAFELLKGQLVHVKLGDPIKAAKELADLRAYKVERELSIKARDQQLRARSLQLELAGAKRPADDPTRRRVVVLPPVRVVADEPESQPLDPELPPLKH